MGHSVSVHTQTYHGAMSEREYQEVWERVVKGRQLIEKSLEKNNDIVCVRFNPWFFTKEEKLLLSFFQTLADALERRLKTKAEDIAGWLTKCGEVIAPLSVADPTGSVRGSGQILTKIGNLFSQVELEENKKRIENILKEENKRLVIFIDDIDRLDKPEVQSIFKLVKLSADFKNTTYLLAFDEEKVANAISEKYGSGNLEAGRNFLEKIIQIPLALPKTSDSCLQKFCFECINKALESSSLEVSDEDSRRFVKHFAEGLSVQLKNPRVAQRYGNTIAFSIPLLKEEVDIIDLLLIEGIKVFYPKLYSSIKNKPSYFLGEVFDMGGDFARIKNIVNEYIEQSISELSQEAQICAKKLLKALFPRLTGVLGNTNHGHYGPDWQKKWTQQKRIASIEYFERYFAYSIPENDISDQKLLGFIDTLEQGNPASIREGIRKVTRNQSSSLNIFFTKIFRKSDCLSSLASQNLALALASMGSYFPRPKTFSPFGTAFSRAGVLVAELIKNVEESDNRLILAKQVLESADPVHFALECFRWIKSLKEDDEKDEDDNLFSEADTSKLVEAIIHRIKKLTSQEAILLRFPENAHELLSFWARCSSKEETNNYLRVCFQQEPSSAFTFIKTYMPTYWPIDMESPYSLGLPSKGKLSRHTYDQIVSVVDAETLINAFKEVCGDTLDSVERESQNDYQSAEEMAACQFIYLHNQATADDSSENSSPE
jgi:hypothetical protein